MDFKMIPFEVMTQIRSYNRKIHPVAQLFKNNVNVQTYGCYNDMRLKRFYANAENVLAVDDGTNDDFKTEMFNLKVDHLKFIHQFYKQCKTRNQHCCDDLITYYYDLDIDDDINNEIQPKHLMHMYFKYKNTIYVNMIKNYQMTYNIFHLII